MNPFTGDMLRNEIGQKNAKTLQSIVERKRIVIDYVTAHPGCSTSEISEKLRIGYSLVRSLLRAKVLKLYGRCGPKSELYFKGIPKEAIKL